MLLNTGIIVYLIIAKGVAKTPKAAVDSAPNSIDLILSDMRGKHEGCPYGVPLGYSWQANPEVQVEFPPDGFSAIIGWGQVYQDCSVSSVPSNLRVHLRRMKVYGLSKSTGRWTLMQSTSDFTGSTYSPSYDSCCIGTNVRQESEGISFVPLAGRPFHFYPKSRASINGPDISGIFVTMEGRLILDNPTGPDNTAQAKLMLGSGVDWWRDLTAPFVSDFSNNRGAIQGKLKFLTKDWKAFNGHTFKDYRITSLTSNPPPIDTSSTTLTTPTPSPTPAPTQITTPPSFNSFKAEYFNNQTLSGSPAYSTDTININYNWGTGSPASGINSDHFSARYTGLFNFDGSNYKFNVKSDDGVRVYLDGQLIIDAWKDQSQTNYSVLKTPTSGNHVVTVEYYENGWDAVLIANWTKVYLSSPTPSPTPSPSPTTSLLNVFNAQYFNNMTLSGAVAANNRTASINYNWGTASPIAGVTSDNFSVRWIGGFDFQAGSYTFVATSDDGIRVWVDGVKMLDKWIDQWPTTYSFELNFASAGTHRIIVDYYDHCCGAVAKFNWSKSASLLSPMVVEAEGMRIIPGTYIDSSNNVFSDSSASGFKGKVIWSNGTITEQVNSSINKITVRAKADICDVAPHMVVKIDNNIVLQTSISSKLWSDYTANVNIGSGVHTLAVSFDNDGWTACDRNLRIDKLTVQ